LIIRAGYSLTLRKKRLVIYFTSGKQKLLHPSASVSLIFTDALGMQSDILNFGKIRASFAQVGNDAPAYSLFNTYSLVIQIGFHFLASQLLQLLKPG